MMKGERKAIRVDACLKDQAERHARRLAHSRIPSGQRKVFKVPGSFKFFPGSQEHLSAPDCPVCTVACAVKCQTDDRLPRRELVVRHAGNDVGVVVLNGHQGQVFIYSTLAGVAAGEVIRMHIRS